MAYLICRIGSRRIKLPAVELTDLALGASEVVKTARCTRENYVAIPFGLVDLKANDTYWGDVIFRTLGDGDSSSTRCSSVGFVARRPDDGAVVYSNFDDSATAFARMKFKRCFSRTFTAVRAERLEVFLCFSVDGSPERADGQTIEVYQCSFANITHKEYHYFEQSPNAVWDASSLSIRIGGRYFVFGRNDNTKPCLRVRRFSNPDIYYDVPGKPV